MRMVTLIVLAMFALPLVVPPHAHAAAEPADKEAAKHGTEKGKTATEDKVNIFKGALDLTIWTIAVFLILFAILSQYAWPVIRDGLDKRENDIARDRAEADKAKKEALELRQQLQLEITKAHEESRRIVDKAVADARTSAAEELARGKADLAAEKERLQAEMARDRDQALQEALTQSAELAAQISAKAIGKNLGEDDHRVLLAQSLDEFKAAARGRMTDLQSAQS